MSVPKISPKSKPLVAGVLVLLAIVAVVNVMVFKPGSRRAPTRQVRVQAAQALPLDLGDFRHDGALPADDLAAWGASSTPVLRRDPFGRDEPAAPVESATVAAEEQTPPNPEPAAPVCNAVLLGGGQPAAVISGKSYRLGDQLDQYTVVAIGRIGVKLRDASGADLFLAVNPGSDSPRRSRIVNGEIPEEGLGETSLVEHARGERK